MDTFELKYFSESRLLEISKKIQRERKKKLEEIEWQNFCQKKALEQPEHQQEPKKGIINSPTELPPTKSFREHFPDVELLTPKQDCNKTVINKPHEPSMIADKIVEIQRELPHPENNACSCKMLSPISEETIKDVAQINIVSDQDEDGCDEVMSPIRTLNSGVSSVNFKKIDLRKLEEESALVHFTANINRDDILISGPSSFVDIKYTDVLHSLRESNLSTADQRTDERKSYVLGHLERVVVYQNKMDLHLDKISFLFDKIPKPFDMADKNRRELRAAGFATLFSRNNIYPLERKVTDIEKMLSIENGPPTTGQGPSRSLSKKLVEAHHLAASSLAVYLSHMPTSVLTGVPEKLQKLLELIIELTNLCDQLSVTDTGADIVRQILFGDDLNRSKCQQMLVKVQNQVASIRRNELLSSEKVKHSFAASLPSQVLRHGQKGFRNKISPYAITPYVATTSFKKSFDALARTRFGPPHKPKESKANKLQRKKLSSAGGKKNSTKPAALVRKSDDSSETHVAQFPISQNEIGAETLMEQACRAQAQEIEMGDAKLLIEKELHNNDILSKKLLPKLMEITNYLEKNKEIVSTVKELALYIQNRTSSVKKEVPGISGSTSTLEGKSEHINAHLIILPPYEGSQVPEAKLQQDLKHGVTNIPTEFDDSLACSSSSKDSSIYVNDDKNSDSEKQPTSALHFNTPSTPQSSMSLERNQRETRKKSFGYEPLTVSAATVNDVLKYTTEYKTFIDKIPVYRPALKPWKVISRISNHFLDEALKDIIKELDFDYLVKMMYKLEFE